jgi:hypothetical protein
LAIKVAMGCYKVAGEADTQAEKAGEASGKEGGGHFYQLLGAPRIDQKQTSDLTQKRVHNSSRGFSLHVSSVFVSSY